MKKEYKTDEVQRMKAKIYYESHREDILAHARIKRQALTAEEKREKARRKKERYENDPEFRASIKASSHKYYIKSKIKKFS